jgi:hypothetical protein
MIGWAYFLCLYITVGSLVLCLYIITVYDHCWASCFMSIHYYSLWPLFGLLFYVYTLQLGRLFYGYTLQLGLLFFVYTLMSITINYWVTRKVEYIVFRYRYSTLFKSLCYLYVVSFLFQLIIHAYSIFFSSIEIFSKNLFSCHNWIFL